jgi:hypothetical protein
VTTCSGVLPQTCIDHLEAGIAESARNDFGSAIMTVEARLCNKHTDAVGH